MAVPDLGNASSVAMDGVRSKGGEWQLHYKGQKNIVLQREENTQKQLITCVLVYYLVPFLYSDFTSLP